MREAHGIRSSGVRVFAGEVCVGGGSGSSRTVVGMLCFTSVSHIALSSAMAGRPPRTSLSALCIMCNITVCGVNDMCV